jgi:hypothetical protein
MLPGDEFTFAEWRAARDVARTTPVMLPESVRLAYLQLLEACQKANVPHTAIFGLQGGDRMLYDLLDKPQNVSHAMLLARSACAEDPAHKLALMAHSLQSLDLSKFQL